MNWSEVRKTNAKRSARKTRQERLKAERKARVEAAGGPITVDELRGATRRIEPPAPGLCHDRHVWTFRSRDWVMGWVNEDAAGDCYTWSFCPFASWRQDPDMRQDVPLTPGARKWLAAAWEREQGAAAAEVE